MSAYGMPFINHTVSVKLITVFRIALLKFAVYLYLSLDNSDVDRLKLMFYVGKFQRLTPGSSYKLYLTFYNPKLLPVWRSPFCISGIGRRRRVSVMSPSSRATLKTQVWPFEQRSYRF